MWSSVLSRKPKPGHPFAYLLVLATVGFFHGCHRAAAPAAGGGPPGPTPVTVAPVEVREMTETEEFSARLDAVETVEIRPRVSGYVRSVQFHAGQLVKAGEVLFVINPGPFETTLKLAQANLERARVAAEIAGRESDRAAKLLADKTISPEEGDTRIWRVKDALAGVAAAEATVHSAQINLDYCFVKSPISGRIGRAQVTEGNNVSGVDGFTTLLATVVAMDPIYAYAAVEEATLLRYRRLERENKLTRNAEGRVAVDLQVADGAGYAYHGTIEHFDNRLDPNTGTIVVRSTFPNADEKLLPGLYARVRIPTSGREKALLVPDLAIGTEQSLKYVWTLSPSNTALKAFLTVGGSVDGMRIVKSGLQPGDKVVVNGLQRIQMPGMPLAPETARTTPPNAAH